MIKTYVRIGMGVGIIAEMAVLPKVDADLVFLPASALFGKNLTRLAFRKGAYLRQFVMDFAKLLNPKLTQKVIQESMQKSSTKEV